MMIRILCIVIAFIVAVWVSRKINLSRRMDSNLYVTSECGCGFPGNYNSSQLQWVCNYC